jgi:hypothetical protein
LLISFIDFEVILKESDCMTERKDKFYKLADSFDKGIIVREHEEWG